MEYGFAHQDKVFGTSGVIPISAPETDAYNKACEQTELEHLKTHPDKVFLYVRHAGWTDIHGAHMPHARGKGEYWSHECKITTWPGTVLAEHAWIGSECHDNFGGTRAAIECMIFGVRYVGWAYTSAGDYCRLRRAKR